jgi:hypothetical protein
MSDNLSGFYFKIVFRIVNFNTDGGETDEEIKKFAKWFKGSAKTS